MELLIVYVDFAHLGLHRLAGLDPEQHVCFLFFDGITLRRNACVRDVGRKLEGWLLETAWQVVTLGASNMQEWE